MNKQPFTRPSVPVVRVMMLLNSVCLVWAQVLASDSTHYQLAPDGTRLTLQVEVDEATLEVRSIHDGKVSGPMIGSVEASGSKTVFVPLAPFQQGQTYRVQWEKPKGTQRSLNISIPTIDVSTPFVRLEPETTLPANALKVYLHFSEPMEQGVFLDRLRLLDDTGKEILGPFRETELWSPDGKRLTVWFHPGRQKTGVNLNIDEGPVFRPNKQYILIVAANWRSTAGVAIGRDQKFTINTTEADHACPQITQWAIQKPRAGTREALQLRFDEGMDPAMLQSALKVRKQGSSTDLHGTAQVNRNAKGWRFVPATAWEVGEYEVVVDPELEDLAGNTLIKPFEVDLGAPASPVSSTPAVSTLRFRVEH